MINYASHKMRIVMLFFIMINNVNVYTISLSIFRGVAVI